MKQEAMQKHPEEWFFLHNFDVDRVFSTIRRTDYLVLFYIKMRQESHPDEKLYLADLAAEMGVKVTELSKGIEKLQDQGYVRWLTDREAGRTYVECVWGQISCCWKRTGSRSCWRASCSWQRC